MRSIALLTDFGARDPYVAAMKGVIAGRCDARILDLSHDIAPFDVWEAAFFLRAIVDYWRDAVLVAVIDPGVGTSRRILAVERGELTLLAPDNGVLTFAGGEAFQVTDESLFLPRGSTTFHGRDRFAPIAAAIANGRTAASLGPRVSDRVALRYDPPEYSRDGVQGTIIAVDRFGNLITDVEIARVPFGRFAVRAGRFAMTRVARTYADAGQGAFVIVGSTGCIEISVANGSAAKLLEMERGARVEVVPQS